MRAKNEFKFLAEAYNTKLILERVVDGKLMCPEACCGAPVMECKCGPDCEHCNCHEIQKLKKEEDAEEFDGPGMQWDGIDDDYDTELPVGHYDTHVRLQRGGRWNAHTVNVRKTDKELIQKFLDQGFRIVKPFDEDNEEPTRSITGMKQKLDALAAAQLAGSKHKPYVSSFVGDESDGFRKIFAVLGSDGKIVHKTRDKKEAHQWLKDNYENI